MYDDKLLFWLSVTVATLAAGYLLYLLHFIFL